MAAISLQAWQWGILAGLYVLLFILPAVWMWRRARRDGDAALAWALLVAVTSVLGIYEYTHHRRILKRRAARAAAAIRRDESQPPSPPAERR